MDAAVRDQYLGLRVVGNAMVTTQLRSGSLPHVQKAAAGPIMSQALAQGFHRYIQYWLRRRKVRVANLKPDNFLSASFQGIDPVTHCNGRRLAQFVELSIETLHGTSLKIIWQ